MLQLPKGDCRQIRDIGLEGESLKEDAMESYTRFPDRKISGAGPVSNCFQNLGIKRFVDACRFVHELPYGYNSDRDDLLILFKENLGSCTTKHAVIAALAAELDLQVVKKIGIYAMTETIVTGTGRILEKYGLPCIPMVHCFLSNEAFHVDLTEGNANGKNCSIEQFIHTETVIPNISEKEEYLLYRNVLKEKILKEGMLAGIEMKIILRAREEGIAILKANI